MAGLNFSIPDDIHQAAKLEAVKQRISLKEFVIRAIAEKLDRDAKKK